MRDRLPNVVDEATIHQHCIDLPTSNNTEVLITHYGTQKPSLQDIYFSSELLKSAHKPLGNVKDVENCPPKETTSLKKFTPEQWIMFAMFAIITFGTATILSIQAPFYPAEAETKGATATEYGLVFGIYELVIFLVSPLYGKYLVQIGPKFLLNAGIFVNAIGCILFGFLDKVDSKEDFLALSFVIRIFQGLGQAGYMTACFALVAQAFPGRADTTFTSIQSFFGIGIIVGPTLGGALYQVGGFILPFAASGGMLLVAATITYFLLKPPENGTITCRKAEAPSIIKVLKMPEAVISIYTTFCGACSLGCLAATLEPHLRQFHLTPVLNGLMFVVSGATLAFGTPIWGQIFKRQKKGKLLCGIASIMVCSAWTLLGPAPYMPFETALWICIIALMLQGFGVGGEVIIGLIGSLHEAKSNGFPDNLQTYGLMSSLWGSSFALGAFVGPTIGGLLLDRVGYRMGTLFIISQHGLLAIINLAYFIVNRRTKGAYLHVVLANGKQEDEPLLKKNKILLHSGHDRKEVDPL